MNILEEPMTRDFNNAINPKYKNIIRNLYFNDILEETATGINNLRPYLKVVKELFIDNIVDYKLVVDSSINMLKKRNILSSILSGYYFRASIMNPYLVYSLNSSILHGKKVFTPTLGWSSYLYGFLESGIEEYVGVDVIPKVCNISKQIAEFYGFNNIEIYCQPSEDLLNNKRFLNKYTDNFDIIFFSPPYYRLELYNGGEQSTDRYKDYDQWLKNYWEKTIKLCYLVAKKKCKLCYIVSNYDNYSSMVNDMNSITNKYFNFSQQLFLSSGKKFSHSKNSEIINIFIKE
jgi:16S rRNA G966 N2-methylase RsmD